MTRGRRDIWRRHGNSEGFESDRSSIRRAAHSKRHDKPATSRNDHRSHRNPRARFPDIAGNSSGSSIFTIARAIRQPQVLAAHSRPPGFIPRVEERSKETRSGLTLGILCNNEHDSSTVNCIMEMRKRLTIDFDCFKYDTARN